DNPVEQMEGAAGGTGGSVLPPRVEPDIDPRGDVAEAVDGDEHPDGEHREAKDDPARAFGGDVEHRDEQPEEQQRGAQVALGDEHEDTRGPHGDERAEIDDPGELDAEELRAGEGEPVPV